MELCWFHILLCYITILHSIFLYNYKIVASWYSIEVRKPVDVYVEGYGVYHHFQQYFSTVLWWPELLDRECG
jgi:hypothetical protein